MQGWHLVSAAWIWLSLFVYGIFFPCWCFYIVRRTANIKAGKAGLMDRKRFEKYVRLFALRCSPLDSSLALVG